MPKLHIMVVEDNQDTLEYVTLLLTFWGFKVSIWSSAHTVINDVTEQEPDLVLLDSDLGSGDDGWTIAQALHASTVTKRIPVIVCSIETLLLQTHRVHMQAMGGDVLEKPFTPEQLLAMIDAVTTKRV